MMKGLTIGQVARQSGMPAKTIRYYEDIDLICRVKRADNGYRMYDMRTVETLRFIKRTRDLGFSIDEVAALLALWNDPSRTSAEVKRLVRRHVGQVEQKIAELHSVRRTLQTLADRCHGDERPDCPILEDLARGPPSED